jgi:hypothetical protein
MKPFPELRNPVMLVLISSAWLSIWSMFIPDQPPPSPDFLGVIGSTIYAPRPPVVNNVGERVIVVTIDSPGGLVDTMFEVARQFEKLRYQGYVIECHLKGYAASAAFFILTQCDRRIGYPDSLLMWHEPAVMFPFMTRLSLSEAKALYVELQVVWDASMEAISRGCNPPFWLPKPRVRGFCAPARNFAVLWRDEIDFNAHQANWYSPGFFYKIYTRAELEGANHGK